MHVHSHTRIRKVHIQKQTHRHTETLPHKEHTASPPCHRHPDAQLSQRPVPASSPHERRQRSPHTRAYLARAVVEHTIVILFQPGTSRRLLQSAPMHTALFALRSRDLTVLLRAALIALSPSVSLCLCLSLSPYCLARACSCGTPLPDVMHLGGKRCRLLWAERSWWRP